MKKQVESLLSRSMIIRRMTRVSLAAILVCAASISHAPMVEAASQYSPKYADIVVDANTGKVLKSADPDGLRYPASLTKMMTLYLVFEALERGKLRLDSPIRVSAHAASQKPSKLGVRAGTTFTVEQGIMAIVTRSANDVSTAFGEALGGTEPRFAEMMTAKARALGMSRTTYRNANGLPNASQMTTARDQARLGMALYNQFPQYYHYFSTRKFVYGKQVIGSHNRLVGSVRGVDGIKTGFTNASGFNLATSVHIDGKSMVAVVLGGVSTPARDNRMRQLVATYLPQASSRGTTKALLANQTSVPEPVVHASRGTAPVPSLPMADVPVPGGRYDGNTGLEGTGLSETAYANDNQQNAAPQAISTVAPTPKHRKGNLNHPVPPANVDNTVTFSTKPVSGWTVQIGVAGSHDDAMDLLKSAKTKANAGLKGARPFAVAYGEGSSKVYRARFVGFNNQQAALDACKSLKKAGVSCWAAMQ
ncbi:D-alanyl-D-alanine carboxypeptidase [Agrobacterium vitis]|nr:D-alanyl-D-alanine carboxypeptidase [Agrobacterium vitis]MBE1437628.1 D-alanyl-D-alanine carboxypeptidase [Agrobacterium vitis]